MRIILIIAVLSELAFVTNCKFLGEVIFFFIAGCALFGVGDFIRDCSDGYGFTARGQIRRQMARHPEEVVKNFERWRTARDDRRLARAKQRGWL